LFHFLHQPPAWSSDVESAVVEYLALSPPIVGCRIPSDTRIDGQVRAMAATYLPALAIKGMGAVTTEQPSIMESQNYRYLLAQPRESSQIKISTVQIVTVNNVWWFWGQVQKLPGSGETKVFNPTITSEPSARFSYHINKCAQP
jgi:hypothetical protein